MSYDYHIIKILLVTNECRNISLPLNQSQQTKALFVFLKALMQNAADLTLFPDNV